MHRVAIGSVAKDSALLEADGDAAVQHIRTYYAAHCLMERAEGLHVTSDDRR